MKRLRKLETATMAAALLFMAGLSSTASAQGVPPFVELPDRGGESFPECSQALKDAWAAMYGDDKTCGIMAMYTREGEAAQCHCRFAGDDPNASGNQPSRMSNIQIRKLIDPADPRDPCQTYTINGQQHQVCW